jgi:hypothetical protein
MLLIFCYIVLYPEVFTSLFSFALNFILPASFIIQLSFPYSEPGTDSPNEMR